MRLLCPDLLPICFLFPIFTWKRSMFLSNRLMHLRYLLLVAVCVAVPALSQNICRISHREGFSNCSILSLAQDADGYVWAGSCDGLNLWDGHYARNFRLSGNLVQGSSLRTTATCGCAPTMGSTGSMHGPEPPNCMPTSRVFTNIRHGAVTRRSSCIKGVCTGMSPPSRVSNRSAESMPTMYCAFASTRTGCSGSCGATAWTALR